MSEYDCPYGCSDKIRDAEARAEQAETQLAIAMQIVHATCDDMDCLPACDSYGHDVQCPVANPAVAWRTLRERAEQAERERDEARADAIKERASLYAALEDAQTQRIRESHANTDLARSNRVLTDDLARLRAVVKKLREVLAVLMTASQADENGNITPEWNSAYITAAAALARAAAETEGT